LKGIDVTWARGILWIVTLSALAGTVYFGLGWYRYNLKLEKWRTEVLMEVPVDVSKAGTITGNLTLTTLTPCRVEFVLALNTEQVIDASMLKPLSGKVTITQNGLSLFQIPVEGEWVEKHWTIANAYIIASPRPWDREACTFEFKVTNPVSKFEGVQQKLLIKNQLCGIEGMVLVVYVLFASLCIIAGLIAVYVLYRMRKSRLVAEVAKASDELR
jgi:hypothetical protein